MPAGVGSMRSQRVGLVGLGRLGLCQALAFEAAGWEVLGCDVDPRLVASVNDRTLTSQEPEVDELLRSAVHLRATSKLEEVMDFAELVYILVATPTGDGAHAYDTSAPRGHARHRRCAHAHATTASD
jgi:UDPglucose 6-dehydrogenase